MLCMDVFKLGIPVFYYYWCICFNLFVCAGVAMMMMMSPPGVGIVGGSAPPGAKSALPDCLMFFGKSYV